MTRINLDTGEIIKKQEFTGSNPEKQLQKYVEKYLKNLLGCYLLKSFYKIPGGEIDTLAITEDGVPCIIEYKHKKEDTILNQIVFYYDWLDQRPTKFEFERIVKENEITKKSVIDWSKVRLICIAEEYSKWDISLIKHLDSEIECYSYTYHKGELDIHLDPHINQFKKQRYTESKSTVVKELTLENFRNKADEKGKKLLDAVRERVLKLGEDIEEGFTPEYIKYFVDTTFFAIHVRKNWLILHLRVNEATFKDPKGIAKDVSSRNWTVTREIKFSEIEELDYILSLIEQAYNSQH